MKESKERKDEFKDEQNKNTLENKISLKVVKAPEEPLFKKGYLVYEKSTQ